MPQSPYDPKKSGRGVSKELTPKDIEQLEKMGSMGMPIYQMAYLLGMHTETLRRWIKKIPEAQRAMELGKATSSYNVRATLYNMASSGDNFQATKFWLKTQEGFRETDRLELTGKDGEEIKVMNKIDRAKIVKRYKKMLDDAEEMLEDLGEDPPTKELPDATQEEIPDDVSEESEENDGAE